MTECGWIPTGLLGQKRIRQGGVLRMEGLGVDSAAKIEMSPYQSIWPVHSPSVWENVCQSTFRTELAVSLVHCQYFGAQYISSKICQICLPWQSICKACRRLRYP